MQKIKDIINNLNADTKKIFGLIQKNGPLTKNEILNRTRYKLTTLNRLMKPLEDSRLINESGMGESSGGRKPLLYDVDRSRYTIIGIDISRTYTLIVFTNLKMELICKYRFRMTEDLTPEKTINRIIKIIEKKIHELNIDIDNIIGIGIGAVAPIDIKNGIILNPKYFASYGWDNVPIASILKDKLNKYVILENGANLAVLVENLFGVGKNTDSIAYFNCGVGLRTGVVSSGTLVRAINNSEDAFGHMVVDVDGKKCYCGNYGCIECYATILAIVDNYISAVKRGRQNNINKEIEEIDYKDICKAAENDDPLSVEVIIEAATIFGVGLANYINLLNPEMVILSGPLVTNSRLYYNYSKKIALQRYYGKENNNIVFSKGGFFKDSVIGIGGACLVIEKLLK